MEDKNKKPLKWIMSINEFYDSYETEKLSDDELKSIVSQDRWNRASGKNPNVSDVDLNIGSRQAETDNMIAQSYGIESMLNKKLPLLKYFKKTSVSDSPAYVNIIYLLDGENYNIKFNIKKVGEKYHLSYESNEHNGLVEEFSMYEIVDKSQLVDSLDEINQYMLEFEDYINEKYGETIF